MRAIPPDHLLRQVFETAQDLCARRSTMLETTPVARPVIYTLAGCRPGERCVIERTEDGFNTRDRRHGAANDWLRQHAAWEGRIGAEQGAHALLRGGGAEQPRPAARALALWRGSFARDSFGWVAPPVLNPYTRHRGRDVPGARHPARGRLRAAARARSSPEPVTQPCELRSSRVAA